jgi:hypothetical protein
MRYRALALILVLVAPVAAAAQTPAPDPYAIFSGARNYWLRQHYPARIGYTVAVDVLEGGAHKVEHYSSAYDAVGNAVEVNPLSDYEIAHPASGRGVNLVFAPFSIGRVQLSKPEPPLDFIGVPSLAPNYSFAIAPFVRSDAGPKSSAELVQEVRAQFHDVRPTPAPTALPSAAGLQEIAAVTAAKRRYAISLVGIETIDGAPAYHLALQPLGNPHVFRLRDLWVDTSTYATRQLVNAGNFTDGPWPGLKWTVRFASIDGGLYISDEYTADPTPFRGLRYLDARVTFADIHPVERTALDDVAQYRPSDPDLFAKEPAGP